MPSPKLPKTILLVEGVGAIPDNRYDSSKFMRLASILTTPKPFKKKQFNHSIIATRLTSVEGRHAPVTHVLWRQSFHKNFGKASFLSDNITDYDTKKAHLDSFNDTVENYVNDGLNFPRTVAAGGVLKQKALPFMLAGYTTTDADTLASFGVEANSAVALAVLHDIISIQDVLPCEDFPREWLEAAVLPEDVKQTFDSIAAKNRQSGFGYA